MGQVTTTLRDVLLSEPSAFYRQTWYANEAFMNAPHPLNPVRPRGVDRIGSVPTAGSDLLPHAADLAAAYLNAPGASIWRFFLWTRDVDDYGNPVYVGGVGQFGVDRFQIHRHLRITNQWGCPR